MQPHPVNQGGACLVFNKSARLFNQTYICAKLQGMEAWLEFWSAGTFMPPSGPISVRWRDGHHRVDLKLWPNDILSNESVAGKRSEAAVGDKRLSAHDRRRLPPIGAIRFRNDLRMLYIVCRHVNEPRYQDHIETGTCVSSVLLDFVQMTWIGEGEAERADLSLIQDRQSLGINQRHLYADRPNCPSRHEAALGPFWNVGKGHIYRLYVELNPFQEFVERTLPVYMSCRSRAKSGASSCST